MNYLKIYTLLLCAVLIAACSDDEEQFNSGAATVNLQETAMTVKESAGLCTVPVVVTGEHTGTIRVTFELKDHNAKEDENYIVTTKTLLIPAGQETMNFEFKTVDDKLVNDDRSFDVEIADVKGASIGENKRLTVTIKDNDSSFYETLSGTWIFTGTASATNVSNVQVGFSVRVNTAEEGTEAYEHYLVCSNKNGFDPGEDVASYGPYTIRFKRLALDGSTSDVYRGEYDVETKTVTFENANLIGDMYKDGLIQIQKFRLFGCKMEHIR